MRTLNVCLGCLALAAAVKAQTREFLDAPLVRSAIPVRWNTDAKTLQRFDSQGQPAEFGSNDLFLSKGPVNVTYPRMNPLKIRATASAAAVADPAVATIGKLMDSITSVVTTVAPPAQSAQALANPGLSALRMTAGSGDLAACEAEGSAAVNLPILWSLLYVEDQPNDTTGAKVQRWIERIDTDMGTMPGWVAVRNAAGMIGSDAQALGTRITAIGRAIERVHSCAGNDNSRDRGLYIDADLSQSQNNAVLQQLIALRKAMTQLQAELTNTFGVDAKWVGADQRQFRLNTASITPTLELMQNITVKVVSVNFQFDSSTGALTILSQDAGSVTFRLRRYSILTPEIGTGAVFGTITKPVYGTDKNKDGQTIVAKTSTSSLSINPSLMVNFVCRCSTGPLAPMAQIGTAVSKDMPGILLGLGTRLFGLGKGDISISGGAMFAWVKDLQKLKPGDVVSGTADINADLGYTSKPKTGKYFAVLYKF